MIYLYYDCRCRCWYYDRYYDYFAFYRVFCEIPTTIPSHFEPYYFRLIACNPINRQRPADQPAGLYIYTFFCFSLSHFSFFNIIICILILRFINVIPLRFLVVEWEIKRAQARKREGTEQNRRRRRKKMKTTRTDNSKRKKKKNKTNGIQWWWAYLCIVLCRPWVI